MEIRSGGVAGVDVRWIGHAPVYDRRGAVRRNFIERGGDQHAVKAKSSWIQAAFLIGWALGGGFFGRLGDILGRSRALSLTILTYALFTGLSFFAHTWWELLMFRFCRGLESVGNGRSAARFSPRPGRRRWRPWAAATLQTGVNIGVLLACAVAYVLTLIIGQGYERYVFLVGVVPAALVFWIRRSVPERANGWKPVPRRTPS